MYIDAIYSASAPVAQVIIIEKIPECRSLKEHSKVELCFEEGLEIKVLTSDGMRTKGILGFVNKRKYYNYSYAMPLCKTSLGGMENYVGLERTTSLGGWASRLAESNCAGLERAALLGVMDYTGRDATLR